MLPFQIWQGEEVSVTGPKIPQALEKILQLKEIRQEQLTDPAGQYSWYSYVLLEYLGCGSIQVHNLICPFPFKKKMTREQRWT